MKILFGTPVVTRDDVPVGDVAEVVVDPRTRSVTHLVVQQGLLFENDRLVPADAIASATESGIVLVPTAAELEAGSADYRAEDFVQLAGAETGDVLPGRLWTRPPGVPPSLIPPGLGPVELPADISIPINDVMLLHDTPVLTDDGVGIGHVCQVLTDEEDRITHIVLEQGLVYPEPKLVPVDWFARIEDNQITLSVEKSVVDRLPDYAEPGS